MIGGWPELTDIDESGARKLNRRYIKLLFEVDMSRVSDVKRDPTKVRYLLKSVARNVSTITKKTAYIKDIQTVENENMSRPTVTDYLDALAGLMITEDQPAWNTQLDLVLP